MVEYSYADPKNYSQPMHIIIVVHHYIVVTYILVHCTGWYIISVIKSAFTFTAKSELACTYCIHTIVGDGDKG